MGKTHREDGPARTFPVGTQQYWLHNREVTKRGMKEYRTKNKISIMALIVISFYRLFGHIH
jgi:hypothetical protein